MTIISIVLTLLILSFLILAHEFGHYFAAKKLGVGVDEFSIGLGPAIFQKQGKETLFSIRLFPLGGYCALQGESDEETEEAKDPEKSFFTKSIGKKFLILIAGVIMNFIIGFIIIYAAFIISGVGFVNAFSRSFSIFLEMCSLIFTGFKMVSSGQAEVSDLTGPIGMVEVVEQTYSFGFIALLLFAAMLSINLGIFNLIPIPALDGGQILLLPLDKVKNEFLRVKLREYLIVISYILLMGLALYVAYNDVLRIFL